MVKNDLEKERNEEGEDTELKVTDRRLFDADGQLRGDVAEESASDERTAGFERHPIEEPEGVDFSMLINAMAQPALIFLGEIAHPGTGKQEVNLEQARLQIDLLAMLRVKCRGNLTHEEEALLDGLLYQLRMLAVARTNTASPDAAPG